MKYPKLLAALVKIKKAWLWMVHLVAQNSGAYSIYYSYISMFKE